MSLERFLSRPDGAARELVVANRTEPEPFQQMIEKLFAKQRVAVSETTDRAYPENTVLLIEDGDVIARSPLSELSDAILMVNSDLYATGTRGLDKTTVPDVLSELTDVRFSLRGYPESNSEKLLLILISRQVERRAFEAGKGTLRSSFQHLSRIKDERGTHSAYQKVANTDVDVHVYGVPDWRPTAELDVTMHGAKNRDFQCSWFVLYQPPADRPEIHSEALLAIETGDAEWEGFWTHDEPLIEDLSAYVRANL